MVAADARGLGVGTTLVRFALQWSRERGFAGMQFYAVAESNVLAIKLYKRLQFWIVGTIAGAFAHPTLGRAHCTSCIARSNTIDPLHLTRFVR